MIVSVTAVTEKIVLKKSFNFHCAKGVRIGSSSGPYFPAFGLNTERYSVSLRIQSECGEIRTKITPNMDTLQAVLLTDFTWINLRNCSMVYSETEFVLTKAKFASFHIGLVMTGLAIVSRSSRIELF